MNKEVKINRKAKKHPEKALKSSGKKALYKKSVFTAVVSLFVVFCAVMTVGLAEDCFVGALLFGVVGATAVLVGLDAGVWDE